MLPNLVNLARSHDVGYRARSDEKDKVRGSKRQKRDREPAAISALTARTPLPKWMAVSDAWIAWRLSAKSSSACAWNGRNK